MAHLKASGTPYPGQRYAEQIRELAGTVALQAQAIADGKIEGPLHGAVRLLGYNVDTLKTWTADDRI